MSYGFRAATTALRCDPALLPRRDRAVIRILERCGAATATQLALLAYPNRHRAQVRLRRLYGLGFLERMGIPPAEGRGGNTFAYRISSATARRLDYEPRPRLGPGYFQHTLDAVDAVCALVSHGDPETEPLVTLWLPEGITGDMFGGGVRPDGIVVLDTAQGSAVVCLEIDEATQHAGPIQDKVCAYGPALASSGAWWVLLVAPSRYRVEWMGRTLRAEHVKGVRVGATTLADLWELGLDAPVSLFGPVRAQATLRGMLTSHLRRTGPISPGTAAWCDLLGSGGGELIAPYFG